MRYDEAKPGDAVHGELNRRIAEWRAEHPDDSHDKARLHVLQADPTLAARINRTRGNPEHENYKGPQRKTIGAT